MLALVIFHSYQLKRAVDEREQLSINLTQLQPVLPKAQLVQVSMLRVSQDLIKLAQDGNPAAQQIINDFRIRHNTASPAAESPEATSAKPKK